MTEETASRKAGLGEYPAFRLFLACLHFEIDLGWSSRRCEDSLRRVRRVRRVTQLP